MQLNNILLMYPFLHLGGLVFCNRKVLLTYGSPTAHCQCFAPGLVSWTLAPTWSPRLISLDDKETDMMMDVHLIEEETLQK
jgi:hypothetical protein